MRVTIYKCDACKRNYKLGDLHAIIQTGGEAEFELCEYCIKKIYKYIVESNQQMDKCVKVIQDYSLEYITEAIRASDITPQIESDYNVIYVD